MSGHVALDEDRRTGGIDAERQVLRGGNQGAPAQHRGILRTVMACRSTTQKKVL